MATQKTGTSVRDPAGGPAGDERPQRADARRNRELLVAAARDAFAAQGTGASMDAIAKRAGVGVGTMYRHFPNRLDLVEAVYQSDVEELWATAQRVVAELEPGQAVSAFFDAFMRYAQTKQALLAELQQAFEKKPDFRSQARELIESSFNLVIDNARDAGAIRPDVEGSDVMQLVSPICTNGSIPPERTERLLGMILDGMRADATRPAGV